MSEPILLTFNPGSSSIKLGLFATGAGRPRRMGHGAIDLTHVPLSLKLVESGKGTEIPLSAKPGDDLHVIIDELLDWLKHHFSLRGIAAVGHRVVHGGDRFDGPTVITDETLSEIEALIPLDPLHQPQSVGLIKAMRVLRPELVQTASFDTAFHRTQTDLVRRFALPRVLFDQGIKRFGFHGLSYKFIAARLAQADPDLAEGKIVVAHLGSGASLCALESGVSRDTTMSFSTLDGLPMATRCGALDPGVVIHLVKQLGWPIDRVEDVLYHQSGLLGVSGLSGDSRVLCDSASPQAREALDLFAFRVSREIASMAHTLGGIDGLVFTAGIGEHQPSVRAAICQRLSWLGIEIDSAANLAGATRIEAIGSKAAILIIPTDEEQVIAEEACALLEPKHEGPPATARSG